MACGHPIRSPNNGSRSELLHTPSEQKGGCRHWAWCVARSMEGNKPKNSATSGNKKCGAGVPIKGRGSFRIPSWTEGSCVSHEGR